MNLIKGSADAEVYLKQLLIRIEDPGPYSLLARSVRASDVRELLADTSMWEQSRVHPVLISQHIGFWRKGKLVDRQFLYQNSLYILDGEFTVEQEKLLVLDAFDAERRKFERLQHKFNGKPEERNIRTKIPEQTRIEVWHRDGGMCTRCGSRERLEYDHIIPISKGGSNTARNMELLCENCNRSKRDSIG